MFYEMVWKTGTKPVGFFSHLPKNSRAKNSNSREIFSKTQGFLAGKLKKPANCGPIFSKNSNFSPKIASMHSLFRVLFSEWFFCYNFISKACDGPWPKNNWSGTTIRSPWSHFRLNLYLHCPPISSYIKKLNTLWYGRNLSETQGFLQNSRPKSAKNSINQQLHYPSKP